MDRLKTTSPAQEGRTITENGEQYFVIGRNKIRIREHFPESGKQIDELVTNLIMNKAKEKADKTE